MSTDRDNEASGNQSVGAGALRKRIPALSQQAQANPSNASNWSDLGVALWLEGKIQTAIALYRRALSLDPNSSAILSNLGGALSSSGELDDAIIAFTSKRKVESLQARLPRQRVLMLLMLLFVASFCTAEVQCKDNTLTKTEPEITGHFKPAGKLNYTYDPGVIISLRNGKILALDGYSDRSKPSRTLRAADGRIYGRGFGMIELFDPKTGKSTVQTRMPFGFVRGIAAAANRRQAKAVELLDGRVFMVGMFYSNRTQSYDESAAYLKRTKNRNSNKYYLPIYSIKNPKKRLNSIGPPQRPNMFALLYDPRNQSFEVIDSTDNLPPRWFTELTLLSNGNVLITGGCISADCKMPDQRFIEFPERRVLLFDPGTKKFRVVGKLLHARYGHETIFLGNNKFLLINGCGVSEAESKKTYCSIYGKDGNCISKVNLTKTHEVELFDLELGNSKILGHTLTGRYDFSAFLFPNQRVFIQGGARDCLGGYDAAELLDLKTGTTVYIGEDFIPQANYPVTHEEKVPYKLRGEGIDFRSIYQGRFILLAGMKTAYLYDWKRLTDRTWLKKQKEMNLLEPRYHHHIVKTPTERVFVIGGKTFDKATATAVASERNAELIEEFIYQK